MFTLADSTHPLRIFIGGNSKAEATLTVELKEKPPVVPSFASLVVESRARDDGSWLLLLQLRSEAGFAEFVAMSAELIDRSAAQPDEELSFRELMKGLDQWRQLFRPIKGDLLTDDQLRGLSAELFCMLEVLTPDRSWAEVIQGWGGPLGAPQDFTLNGGLSIETKSLHPDTSVVRISSLAQLDPPEGQRLALVGVVVTRETPESPGAKTVIQMCEEVLVHLEDMFDLADEFRLKLRELRFDPAEPAYADQYYIVRSPRAFAVSTDFPRIVRDDVRVGIADAEYQIEWAGIAPFEVPLQMLATSSEKDISWN